MNPRTQRYVRYGIHSIMDYEQKQAWQRHLDGEAVPLTELPTNGEHCPERTMGSYCGFPLLVDATCPNSANHRDVVEALTDDEPEVTGAMVAALRDGLLEMVSPEVRPGVRFDLTNDDYRELIESVLRAQRTES
jgi:hypothetical protein